MKLKRLSLNLKVLYVAEFGALACYLPFLTVYFQQKGLSLTEIGLAYALYSLVGVITQPIWGVITDKYSNKRTTLLVTMALSGITVFALVFANNFYIILLSIVLFLSFQSSIIPVADAFTYEIIETHKGIEYGKIRLLGSLGYAVFAIAAGQVVKFLGINFGFFMYTVIILLGVVFVYQIDFKGKNSSKAKVELSDFISLIKEKRFLIFMVAIVFVNVTLGSNMAYISVLIEKTGGDISQLGNLGFIAAISELPILYFGSKLMNKYGELNIFLFGMICFILRYFLNSISTSYSTVLMIQIMQCLTYTLFLISSLQYLNKITPSKIRTSAMTFYTAVCGIGTFIGNIGGGILLEQVTIFSLYKVLACISVVSALIILVLKKIDESQYEEAVIIQTAVSCAKK